MISKELGDIVYYWDEKEDFLKKYLNVKFFVGRLIKYLRYKFTYYIVNKKKIRAFLIFIIMKFIVLFFIGRFVLIEKLKKFYNTLKDYFGYVLMFLKLFNYRYLKVLIDVIRQTYSGSNLYYPNFDPNKVSFLDMILDFFNHPTIYLSLYYYVYVMENYDTDEDWRGEEGFLDIFYGYNKILDKIIVFLKFIVISFRYIIDKEVEQIINDYLKSDDFYFSNDNWYKYLLVVKNFYWYRMLYYYETSEIFLFVNPVAIDYILNQKKLKDITGKNDLDADDSFRNSYEYQKILEKRKKNNEDFNKKLKEIGFEGDYDDLPLIEKIKIIDKISNLKQREFRERKEKRLKELDEQSKNVIFRFVDVFKRRLIKDDGIRDYEVAFVMYNKKRNKIYSVNFECLYTSDLSCIFSLDKLVKEY